MAKSFDLTQYFIPVAEETLLADSPAAPDIEKTIVTPTSSEPHTHYKAHTVGAMTYFHYYFDAPKACIATERPPRSRSLNFSTSGLIGVGLFGVGAVTGYLLSEVKHNQIEPSQKIKPQQKGEKVRSVVHSAKPEQINPVQFRSATGAQHKRPIPSTISTVKQSQSATVFATNQPLAVQFSQPVIQPSKAVTLRRVSNRRVAKPRLTAPSAIAAPEFANSPQQENIPSSPQLESTPNQNRVEQNPIVQVNQPERILQPVLSPTPMPSQNLEQVPDLTQNPEDLPALPQNPISAATSDED